MFLLSVFEDDEKKSARNSLLRDFPFDRASAFDSAHYEWFVRDGGERLVALGYIGMRLHVLVLTFRDKPRVISLRKANPREVRKYEKAKAKPGGA